MGKPKGDKKEQTSAAEGGVAKEKKALPGGNEGDIDKVGDGVKKVKRAWRNKLRKQKTKEAAALARKVDAADEVGEKAEEAEGDGEQGENKKKKKKKKKSKKDWDKEEEEKPLDQKAEMLKSLEAGRFRFLNEQLYTMSGSDAWTYFQEDPSAFHVYHAGFAEQCKKWPNHPLLHIIAWLGRRPTSEVVMDLGCGEAKIAAALGNTMKIHSFDLVAVNDRVTACDMAKLPLEDGAADVAVFCLSLMGTNLADYIREARRCLKPGGTMKVAEVMSRFGNLKLFADAVCKMGFKCKEKKKMTDYFIMFEFERIEKVENKRPFGLKLKPCVYKKR